MTAPKLSHQIPDPDNPNDPDGIGRMYSRYPGGTPEVPSITTVIDVLNPKMEWWRGYCAGKEAIKFASLIVERQKQSETDPEQWRHKEREIVNWISETSVRDMKVASQRGDLIHNYAEAVARQMLGEDYDLKKEYTSTVEQLQELYFKNKMEPDDAEGYLKAVHKFFEDFQVVPITAEGTVWNDAVGYAGTNDLFCKINGKLTLLDWKTKKKLKDPRSRWYKPSIKETIALQLEAAQHGEAVYSEVTNEWTDWEGINAEQQVGVAIGPNGYEAIRVVRKPDTWETFKALRVAWGWVQPDNEHIVAVPLTPNDL